jgi:valine dehydrogenase (NAD+)
VSIAAPSTDSHEQVTFCNDAQSGLRAIVAIYSTALGPALGGTRCFPYASDADALADVLNLSKAMAYKNSLAGLDHGGGKAVIIGDPATVKTEQLLRAYGRFLRGLAGRYITACDVGTMPTDMDVVALECDDVTGRSAEKGGSGDSGVLTAFGVHQGMLAAARHRWGADGLGGRRIGVAGVGKVGRALVELALRDGADVVITDVVPAAVERILATHPSVRVVEDAGALVRMPLDVYSPCALGAALSDEVVDVLQAGIVCGGANNQLAHDRIDNRLAQRGITYCPDYVVNAGGVIQVADERNGFSFERAKAKAAKIYDTTLAVLEMAATDGVTPTEAADRLAERRMSSVSGLARIWVPS